MLDLDKRIIYGTLSELRELGKTKSDYERILLIGSANLMEIMARKIFDPDKPHNQSLKADKRTYCKLEGKCLEMTCIGDECKHYQF